MSELSLPLDVAAICSDLRQRGFVSITAHYVLPRPSPAGFGGDVVVFKVYGTKDLIAGTSLDDNQRLIAFFQDSITAFHATRLPAAGSITHYRGWVLITLDWSKPVEHGFTEERTLKHSHNERFDVVSA